MTIQQIQSRGMFHGLPVYPENCTGLTAVITGANGISGKYMLRVLSESPKRWAKIICLSRRPPLVEGGLPSHVEHIPLDFLKDPSEIAQVLQEHQVQADYIFFYSYIQPTPKPGAGLWTNAQDLVDVNSKLLSNFLEAIKQSSITPKRFMLQTGAKNYGGHLGPTKIPQEETDPRITLEPNFYYPQEDLLYAYCKDTGCGWTIHMPGPIVGAVPDAAMNCAFALAVYASISKKLGQALIFPGDISSWQMPQSMSSAQMNAYQEEWAVLLGPSDEKYNTCDNSAFSWEKAWPRIAGWFGIEAKGPEEGNIYDEVESRFVPRGYGPKGVTRRKFRTVDWAKKEEVQKAWGQLVEEHGLKEGILEDVDRVFGFLDGTLCRPAALLFSMDKSRKLGWHGFVDSSEAMLDVFQDFAKLKMVPPIPMAKINPPNPTASCSSPTTGSLLMDLPPELRLIILSHAVYSERPFMIGRVQDISRASRPVTDTYRTGRSPRDAAVRKIRPNRDDTPNRPIQPPVSRVCRTLRKESLPTFYSENEFWLIHNEYGPLDHKCIPDVIPPRNFDPWLNQTPAKWFEYMQHVAICGYTFWPNPGMAKLDLKHRTLLSIREYSTYGDDMPINEEHLPWVRNIKAAVELHQKEGSDAFVVLKAVLVAAEWLFCIPFEHLSAPPGIKRNGILKEGWEYDW